MIFHAWIIEICVTRYKQNSNLSCSKNNRMKKRLFFYWSKKVMCSYPPVPLVTRFNQTSSLPCFSFFTFISYILGLLKILINPKIPSENSIQVTIQEITSLTNLGCDLCMIEVSRQEWENSFQMILKNHWENVSKTDWFFHTAKINTKIEIFGKFDMCG